MIRENPPPARDGRQYHGNFIFSKVRKFDSRRIYYAMIQVHGKRLTKRAGYALEDAIKMRRLWKMQVLEGTFLAPKRTANLPKRCPFCTRAIPRTLYVKIANQSREYRAIRKERERA